MEWVYKIIKIKGEILFNKNIIMTQNQENVGQKSSLLKNYIDTVCVITLQAPSYSINMKLFKPLPQTNTWAPREIQSLTQKYNTKI